MITPNNTFTVVVEYKLQGVDFHRLDLLKKFIRESVPKLVFRGDLEPELREEYYKKTGVLTKNPPGFDDYIIALDLSFPISSD
jgi:hypothetical protein